MEVWAEKSDQAAKDVFGTMRKMFGCADVNARMSLPKQEHSSEKENLNRPVSEAVSELDSRASFASHDSVSELGAEVEPPWLLAATEEEAWQRHHANLATNKTPTRRNLEAVQNKFDLEASWAKTCLPPYEGQFPLLSQVPEQLHNSPVIKETVIESPSFLRPETRSSIQQEPSRIGLAPRVTMQTSTVQVERWAEKHIFNPAHHPTQLDTPSSNTTTPVPISRAIPPALDPPLTALLYFALELPRSSPQHKGGYMRHYAHPMRLRLSTPQQLVASIAHLRGYLTEQTSRFLSHFSSHTTQTTRNEARLVVNFPSLFRAGGHGLEQIWGPELAWAWVDASEERFAEGLVGVLRDVAEEAVRKGKGGTVDVVCVARKVVNGRKGYGLSMDVRRIEEVMRRSKRSKTRKTDKGTTYYEDQSDFVTVGGVEKMWIH